MMIKRGSEVASGDTPMSKKIRPLLFILIGVHLYLFLHLHLVYSPTTHHMNMGVGGPAHRYSPVAAEVEVEATQNMPPSNSNRELVQKKTKTQQNGRAAKVDESSHSQSSSEPGEPQLAVSTIPLPVYTREMATQAIRPAPWTCGDRHEEVIDPLSEEKPMFAFVHVYKAAGSTIRTFFQKYSQLCRKSWMVLISCTGVTPSSIQSDEDWKKCRVKEVVDGRKELYDHESMKKRRYPTVNNTVIRENVDIYGGHMRIGTGDSILFSNSTAGGGDYNVPPPVRHIVFLRDPKTRFVSGILYQINRNHNNNNNNNKDENSEKMEDIVAMIKKRIRGSRAANEYWGTSLSYLLTPSQANMKADQIIMEPSTLSHEEQRAEAKARAAIQNLVHYNVIMGVAERMSQSMQILRHVLVSGEFTSNHRSEYVKELFNEYIPEETEEDGGDERPKKDVRRNVSERDGGVSTTSVLEEIRKDAEFMPIFEEYIKYEQMITDFAWQMHSLQYEVLMEI